jgi:CIC family chloride channel protein
VTVAADDPGRLAGRWGRLRLAIAPHRRDELQHLALRSRQVLLLAAATGILTGTLVAGLDRLVIDVVFDRVVTWRLGILAFAPLAGLIGSWAARRWIGGGVSAATADEYLHAFHDGTELGWRALLGRLVASVATVATGVPMGLEGPSLYAGATIGQRLQAAVPRIFGTGDRRSLTVAGAAAGVAAIFRAPATGAVFALEVPYQDDLARRMLLPSLVGAATGYLSFAAINGTAALFPVTASPGFRFRDLLGAVAIGAVAGIAARGTARLIRIGKRVAAADLGFLGVVAAGLVLAGLVVATRGLTGRALAIGSGYQVVAWASEPGHAIWLLVVILVLRAIATAAAVAGGGTGGLFVPLVAGGAIVGGVAGEILAHTAADRGLFVVIGIAAFLGAGYRVPLAAVMFVAETTGRPSFVVPGLLAAVAGELLMGRSSVTTYQHRTDDPFPESGPPAGTSTGDGHAPEG